ncbi:unnamed protein product [Timema podura]|uniref:Uncharacterized protein n=1 Tax=Timema podura TaxID=61482 RepID=A0ABN7NVB0_TIMPD|nr:unnamed protein product [Timema podura]
MENAKNPICCLYSTKGSFSVEVLETFWAWFKKGNIRCRDLVKVDMLELKELDEFEMEMEMDSLKCRNFDSNGLSTAPESGFVKEEKESDFDSNEFSIAPVLSKGLFMTEVLPYKDYFNATVKKEPCSVSSNSTQMCDKQTVICSPDGHLLEYSDVLSETIDDNLEKTNQEENITKFLDIENKPKSKNISRLRLENSEVLLKDKFQLQLSPPLKDIDVEIKGNSSSTMGENKYPTRTKNSLLRATSRSKSRSVSPRRRPVSPRRGFISPRRRPVSPRRPFYPKRRIKSRNVILRHVGQILDADGKKDTKADPLRVEPDPLRVKADLCLDIGGGKHQVGVGLHHDIEVDQTLKEAGHHFIVKELREGSHCLQGQSRSYQNYYQSEKDAYFDEKHCIISTIKSPPLPSCPPPPLPPPPPPQPSPPPLQLGHTAKNADSSSVSNIESKKLILLL